MNDMIRVMLNRMASNQRQCTCSLSVAFVIHILIETKQNRKKNRNSNTHTVTSRRYIAKDGVRQREGAKKETKTNNEYAYSCQSVFLTFRQIGLNYIYCDDPWPFV